MKRIIILCFLVLVASIESISQQIVNAEYFWDTDPGAGNGIAISVIPGQTIDISTNISATGISEGLHTLYIRVKEESERWSHYESMLVIVGENELTEVTGAEYFWDTDPGAGNGIPIDLSAGLSVSGQLSTTAGVDPGIHYIHLRVRDASGSWSHYRRVMVIVEDNSIREIVSMEYFWDTDPGVGNANSVDIDDVLFFDGNVPVSTGDLSLGNHTLYIRVMDETNAWSHYRAVLFTLCETFGALSSFDINYEGTEVSATYTGSFATSYQWLLDDVEVGSTEEITLTPQTAQELCLITANSCGADTTCAVIGAPQLISIDPASVPNNLEQFIDLTGFGFTDDAVVRIEKGTEVIEATSTIFNSSSYLTASFDFDFETIGLWDVFVTQGTSTELLLSEALELTLWSGTDEFDSKNFIGKPFPNPAKDFVMVPYHFASPQSIVIRCYDSAGRFIKSESMFANGSGNYLIDLAGFAGGVYFLEIKVNDMAFKYLIVK